MLGTDVLPAAMREAKRWIGWRPVPDRDDEKKINKIPLDPFTNEPFEKDSDWQTDAARWTSFDQIKGPKGFVLGDGWTGIDLDKCIVNNHVVPWASGVVRALDTYAEISPSGTGIKSFMHGTRSEGAKTTRKCAAWNWEIYAGKRFFTVTGAKLPNAPSVIQDRTAMVQKITETVWGGDLVDLCKLRGLFLHESREDVQIRCPWESEHTSGRGDKDAALQIRDGKVVGFHCFHAHCQDRHLRDIKKWFGITGVLEHPLTEVGDAECFADLYQDQVRFDHRRGRWLLSDEASGIWMPDPVERLTQMTVEMMRTRQYQSLKLKDDEKKKAIAWTIRGESRFRLKNALDLARSVPPIADSGEHWDEDPFLLGVQNGVIDLRTGHWRKATAADRVTMRVQVAYDPNATCPLWLNTLAEIFAPADDLFKVEYSYKMINFVQRAVGYSITGDCREECCFFAWGGGRNGKGTVMNTLALLFGDYTDDMPYSTLEKSDRGSGIPNDVAKLAGKRFITCSEVNEFNLNENRIKALTGRDPITARFLHREFFTFIPVCKIWIATNNKPQIAGQDDGIWSRIHLIPFVQQFDETRANKQLKDQLREELPGILNWIVDGTLKWLRDGLNPPDTVKKATAAYRDESNPITPFIESRCVVDKNLKMQVRPAFDEYEGFCNATGVERRLSSIRFFEAMEKRFGKPVEDRDNPTRTRQKFYIGVALRELRHTEEVGSEAPDDVQF
jgi:P4 family phage/plasmid primase-like protien